MTDIIDQPFTIVGRGQPVSATSPDDWCSKIFYNQIDPCHFKAFAQLSRRPGCCVDPFLFFGISCTPSSASLRFPPTDAGLPAGLPSLPLGFHYAQTSTDRVSGDKRWRSPAGVWALERGKIWIAPWIQSTETVIVTWDGIKRTWNDADAIDDDPLLSEAVEEYVRWKHSDKYDEDEAGALRAATNYAAAKAALIHQCREETRVRECEPSHARSSVSSLTSLFYNAEQRASGACPDGSNPISVTIPAGSVASTISIADANQRALNEATNEVQTRLASLCAAQGNTFQNTAQTATVSCQGEEGAPPPDGNPVTVTVAAGTVTSTVSQADADQQAFIIAQVQASSQLHCTFWNKEVAETFTCTGGGPSNHITVAAHTYSSVVSQADADQKALDDLDNQGAAWMQATCPGVGLFWNTQQIITVSYFCVGRHCTITVQVTVVAHYISSDTQQHANDAAIGRGNFYGIQYAQQVCAAGNCGNFQITVS
jgi:hypothetical protein